MEVGNKIGFQLLQVEISNYNYCSVSSSEKIEDIIHL